MPPCKLRGNHGPLLDRQGWWVGREWPTGCIAPEASAGPAKPEPDLRGLRAGCQPVVSRGGRLRYKMSYTELHP